MGVRKWLMIAGTSAVIVVGAACGGDGDDDVVRGPVLAGTPLPTATFTVSTPPVCEVEEPLTPPSNFPTDVPFPPGYELTLVETDPHLRVEGRIKVPETSFIPEDSGGFLPSTALEVAMIDNMKDRWSFTTTGDVEGRDYDFTAEDGRVGHMNITLDLACQEYAVLALDFFWITPEGAAAATTPQS